MDFLKVLDNIMDSKDVTVGGGSSSAVAAAMAAGLIGMVARLSVEKNGKTYGLPDGEYLACADELDRLMSDLKKGACDDAEAYLGIKAAYALPKETDAQKTARRAAIEDAAVTAANVPLANAKRAAVVLAWALKLKGHSNPNAGSDLACGEMLAAMAVKGAGMNVEANLPLIATPARREALEKELAGLSGN